MAPNNQQQQAAAAAAVRLPDFHADSPQCWFDNLDSQFATANITLSITKFHWAVAKLPFSLTPTIRPLTRDPTAVADPYKKLKDLLLESYGMTDEQRTNKWIDYPMCGSETRPLVLWDNLTALQPASLDEAQVALFIRKLPRHISAMINTKSFDTLQEMVRRCNQLWVTQTPKEAASAAAAAAAAGPWQHSSLRDAQHRRSPSPYRRKTPAATRPATKRTTAAAHPPPGQPRVVAATACASTTPASAARPTSARGAAPTRKTNRPAAGPRFATAACPIPACRPPFRCNT
jgi:hypothetical protein